MTNASQALSVELQAAVRRLTARVGEQIEGVGPVTIELTAVRRFLAAVGCPNDDLKVGDSVPLSYISHIGNEPASVLQDVRPDETLDGKLANPLNGGITLHSFAPLNIGMSVLRRVFLKKASFQESRSAPMAAVIIEIRIVDRDDAVLAAAERTMLYRSVH